MFGIINFGTFLVSSVLLNITPGSDTIYILGNSINGKNIGIMSALGICSGCLIHTVLAALGLSVILSKSALAFNAIKLVGASYLIYLGVRSFVSKSSIILKDNNSNVSSLKKVYAQGVLTNVLNPKVALFYLAFLPQFINPNNIYGTLPFLILGFTFILTSTIWCTLLAVFSSKLTGVLTEKLGISKMLNKISGTVFVILGINLLRSKFE